MWKSPEMRRRRKNCGWDVCWDDHSWAPVVGSLDINYMVWGTSILTILVFVFIYCKLLNLEFWSCKGDSKKQCWQEVAFSIFPFSLCSKREMFDITAMHSLKSGTQDTIWICYKKPSFSTVAHYVSDIKSLKWIEVYPIGYLQLHTDQQQKAQGRRRHSGVDVSCCCWALLSARASGDTWEPR